MAEWRNHEEQNICLVKNIAEPIWPAGAPWLQGENIAEPLPRWPTGAQFHWSGSPHSL